MGIVEDSDTLPKRYRSDSDEEDNNVGGKEMGDGRADVEGDAAGGGSWTFSTRFDGTFFRFGGWYSADSEEHHDYYMQSLHQQRYLSESPYEYYTHHQMLMHIPPHMFMPQEMELRQGSRPGQEGHQSVFPPRMDAQPFPSSEEYLSYPTEHGAPPFTYPMFGTYQREQ